MAIYNQSKILPLYTLKAPKQTNNILSLASYCLYQLNYFVTGLWLKSVPVCEGLM